MKHTTSTSNLQKYQVSCLIYSAVSEYRCSNRVNLCCQISQKIPEL